MALNIGMHFEYINVLHKLPAWDNGERDWFWGKLSNVAKQYDAAGNNFAR